MPNADNNETFAEGDSVWTLENRNGHPVRSMARVQRVEGEAKDAVFITHDNGNTSGPHSPWSLERAEVPR